MSRRARRTNKGRVLGAGLAGAALIAGIAAAGAMAGEDGATEAAGQSGECSSGDQKAEAAKEFALPFPKVAGILSAAGAEENSLQQLDNALQALPGSDIEMAIDRTDDEDADATPRATITSVNEQSPGAYAKSHPDVTLSQINEQRDAVNQSLAEIWTDTSGLENLEEAVVKDAVSSSFGGIEIDIDEIDINDVEIDLGDIEINIDDIEIDDVEIEIKKSDSEPAALTLKAPTSCSAE